MSVEDRVRRRDDAAPGDTPRGGEGPASRLVRARSGMTSGGILRRLPASDPGMSPEPHEARRASAERKGTATSARLDRIVS